jgi:hypothetical protein
VTNVTGVFTADRFVHVELKAERCVSPLRGKMGPQARIVVREPLRARESIALFSVRVKHQIARLIRKVDSLGSTSPIV